MRTGVATALALLAVAAGVACGDGGGSMTLEEYFAEFDAIHVELDDQASAGLEQFPEQPTDADLPLAKELSAELALFVRTAADRLEALDPPVEVESEHAAYVAAAEDFSTCSAL